jgi:flagellar motility protein MotE (MotC chaperone)
MADGQVVINTKLDDKGLKQGITGLQNTSISALKKVKGVLATVGIGVGVVAAVKGINNMIKSTAQLTDRIDKQSQKIGLSRKAYQEWDFVFSQFGTSVDGLQVGIKTLSTAMDEANDGTKEYTELFGRLKVNIHDTNGELKDQETIFNEVFAALAGMENQTERSAIASRLLGRSATELAPALNGGADAIEELRNKAYDLGLVLDDTTVDIGVKLTDTLDQMKRAMQTASARAIEPFMGVVNDLAGSFTENAIPAIEKFLTKAFKVGLSIPPIFSFMKSVVTTVLKEIGEALDEPWEKFKGFVNDIVNMPIVHETIEFALALAGDLYAGLKKGVQSGDWSDFWKASVGAAQFTIGIVATISLAKLAAAGLWATIQSSLAGAGFSTTGLAGGAIAMLSVGLAVYEAMDSGDYSDLASNMIAAIIAGFAVGGLTGNMQAGVLTFTAVLNLKIGEIIAGGITDILKPYQGNDQELLQIQDIIAATEGLLTSYGATSAAKKKLVEIWGIDTGRQIIAGLGVGLGDIDSMGESTARTLLQAVRDQLGIQSPSKEFKRIGNELVNGLESGLEGMSDAGKENAQEFLDATQDILGVHSESDVTHWIGNELVNGLINGMLELFPELEDEAKKMRDALEKIWADGEYKPPVPETGSSGSGGGGTTPGPQQGAVGIAWDGIKEGWSNAKKSMTEELDDWAGWAESKFMEIGPAFGNAMSAGMQSLGQSLADKQATIEELGKSISDIEDTLSDAYDDLQDAQDEYADAVLSGDSDAIKAAKKRVDQQQKLIDGHEETLKALKDEKKSVEDGSKAWGDFAKVMLGALANELYGLGASLAARAALAAVTFNWAGAALAAAGSVAAFGAAIAVDAWAGSFAEGGIVPGTSYSGDKMVANVNSGELILNAAQQDRIASQLAMYSHLTDLLSSLQFSSNGGINIDLRGSTFNDMSEEAVGKAIYHNVRSLQAEGVLPRW